MTERNAKRAGRTNRIRTLVISPHLWVSLGICALQFWYPFDLVHRENECIIIMTTSSPADPPPQAKAADAPPIEDAPPSLETMVAVVWERTLSFLSPEGISTMSFRISKSLGAGEDKAESSENAAKLALENMLSVAWLKSESSYVGAAANDDYVEPEEKFEDLRKVPHFEGESYLRTYYIATEMLPPADLDVYDEDGNCFECIAMWTLFGRPPLPPLSKVGFDMAHASADAVVRIIRTRSSSDGTRSNSTEQRLKTMDTLQKFSRERLLSVAERLGKIGCFPEGSFLLTMLISGRTKILDHVYKAEFFSDSRVELKGLSRDELNGKRGTVEKEYDPKMGRVGVALIDEATGKRRIVGIKPANLDLLEGDTTFSIDCKITLADVLCRRIQANNRAKPTLMPAAIHMLRHVVTKLQETVEHSESAVPIRQEGQYESSQCSSQCSSDRRRLFFAESYLSLLLSHQAQCVAMGSPVDFGGLVCENYNGILEMINADDRISQEERKVGQGMLCSRSYLQEAVNLLLSSEKQKYLLEENEDQLSTEAPLVLLNTLVRSNLHVIAGFASQGMGVAMVPLNQRAGEGVGRDPQQNAKDHLQVAVACMRSQLEASLDNYIDSSNNEPFCSVQIICSNLILPQIVVRNMAYLANAIVTIYCGTDHVQLFDDALFPDDESEDAAIMIKFALLVATRSLGFGHPITKKIDALHDRSNGDDLLHVDMLEVTVNEWLKHYTPRYYGTRHEHPALFCEIVGTDLPDFLQGRD